MYRRTNKACLAGSMSLIRHLAGRLLMGVGGSVKPGGNTGLILLGMPMLWSYAWVAFVTICINIYLAIRMTCFT
jgi:hypothetical protein